MRGNNSKPRSSIAHLITPLALILVLVVLYQSWVKPLYSPTAPPSVRTTEGETVRPALDLTIPIDSGRGPAFLPRTRVAEYGDAPSPELGRIRDELEKGNFRQVEAALRKRSTNSTTDPRTVRFVAALWNNLGIQQERAGGTALSVRAFQEAVRLDSRNSTALLNLTQAYWELRHPAMTPQFLETVIRAAPEDPFPHLALADLLLGRAQAGPAARHLDDARRLGGVDPSLASYLRKLTARAETVAPRAQPTVTVAPAPKAAEPRPALPVPAPAATASQPALPASGPARQVPVPPSEELPRSFASPGSGHFLVQYDGPPDRPTWMRMKAILDYAFDEITQKFGHVPSKPIPVVLHMNQKFAEAAGSPLWADMLFDRTSGAMHVPVQGALDDLALFSRVVRHEFVHALLFEYLKGRNSAAPTWLLEGLAVQLSEDPWPDLEEAKRQATAAIPLVSLQGDWKQPTQDSALRAYIEASGATQHLIDRYSIYSVRQVLNLLRAGESLDGAMRQKLAVSYEQFRHQWEQDRTTAARQG